MRFLKLFLTVIIFSAAFFFAQPILADECTDNCSADLAGCSGACGSDATCISDCWTTASTCNEACESDTVTSTDASSGTETDTSAAAPTKTSDTISYKVVSQSTYFSELQARGITFAYVSTKCETTGECTLEDIMQVFVNIANFILGIVGSLTLIITVYGGFLWLTSQGSSEKIEQGRTAMTGSIIGLLIVFGAFAGINLVTSALRGGDPGQTNKCELVSPVKGGKAGTGYACIKTTGLVTGEYTCEDNLCPGGNTIKCCIKN